MSTDEMVTVEAFTERAIKLASSEAGVGFLPMVVLLLPVVIPIVFAWFLTKVLDLLWDHFVKGSKGHRTLFRMLCVRPAMRMAMKQKRIETLTPGEWQQLEDLTVIGINSAARELNAGQLRSLRASAREMRARLAAAGG